MSGAVAEKKRAARKPHSEDMLLTLRTWSSYFDEDLTLRIVYRSFRPWGDWFIPGSFGIPTTDMIGCVRVHAYVVTREEIPDPLRSQYRLRLISVPAGKESSNAENV